MANRSAVPPAAKKCSAQSHDSDRRASSSMLVQLMPVSGGLAASQLASSSTQRCRYFGCPVSQYAPPEREPVLVPIQLPDDLVITAGGVQVSSPRCRNSGVDDGREQGRTPSRACGRLRSAARDSRADRTPRPGSDRHGRPLHVRCQEIRGADVRRGDSFMPALMTNRGATSAK